MHAFTHLKSLAIHCPRQMGTMEQASHQTKDGRPVLPARHARTELVVDLKTILNISNPLTERDLETFTELSEDLEAHAEMIANKPGPAPHRDVRHNRDARELMLHDDRPLQKLSSARRRRHQDLLRDSVSDQGELPGSAQSKRSYSNSAKLVENRSSWRRQRKLPQQEGFTM